MKTLHPSKYKRVILVCSECEERSDGPRDLGAKSVARHLRKMAQDAPVRTRVARTRCLGLCPRKALAALAVGESLAATSAFLQDADDVKTLAHYVLDTDA